MLLTTLRNMNDEKSGTQTLHLENMKLHETFAVGRCCCCSILFLICCKVNK